MKKIISILLALVISCTATVIVCADNIPQYDYSSFVGEWHKIDPDGLNGDVPLRIDYVKNNNEIIFSIDNGELQTRTINNNQVKWTENRYDGSIDLTLTFYDDYIHLQYSRCLEEWYPEITFVSNTCKPRKIITDNYSVVLNGNKLEFDQPPIMCGDRVLVPLRKIFEELGATVDYDSVIDDTPGHYNSEVKYIRAKTDTTELNMELTWHMDWNYTVYKKGDYVDGGLLIIENGYVPPIIINDRTLVPVRFVSETLGADVDWNSDTQTVIINTDNNNGSNNSNNTDSNKILEKEAEQIAINHYYSRTGCGAAGCYSEDANYYYVRVFMTYNPELHQYSFVVGECKVDKYTGEVQEI